MRPPPPPSRNRCRFDTDSSPADPRNFRFARGETRWWQSDFCKPRAEGPRPFLRRCFSPGMIANLTEPSRLQYRINGTVLLYAHDKVAAEGPAVCSAAFGGVHRVAKLALPASVLYTLRNAAEQFFAARAPGPFYGNTLSTFSRGVALMRAAAAARPRPSFAYDCLGAVAGAGAGAGTHRGHEWTFDTTRTLGLASHPGYRHLMPLPDRIADCLAGTDDMSEDARVERWRRRGSRPL